MYPVWLITDVNGLFNGSRIFWHGEVMVPMTSELPRRSPPRAWGVVLALALLTMGATVGHARAQASVTRDALLGGLCAASTASFSRPTQRPRPTILLPSIWLSCGLATYVEALLLNYVNAGSGNGFEPSLVAAAHRDAGDNTGGRERLNLVERSLGRVDGVSGVGFSFSLGRRAKWAISKVSKSSVLLSLRLSV
jgi:hypothetical protein